MIFPWYLRYIISASYGIVTCVLSTSRFKTRLAMNSLAPRAGPLTLVALLFPELRLLQRSSESYAGYYSCGLTVVMLQQSVQEFNVYLNYENRCGFSASVFEFRTCGTPSCGGKGGTKHSPHKSTGPPEITNVNQNKCFLNISQDMHADLQKRA